MKREELEDIYDDFKQSNKTRKGVPELRGPGLVCLCDLDNTFA